MSDHFSYLYEDDNNEFFQKEAFAAAESPRADEIVKTAAPVSRDAYSMEKIASRLEQDIFIIKTAGEAGFNMGAQARADSYLTRLFNEQEFEPEVAELIFDKVASAAIEHDLGIVREELYKLAEDEHRPWVDSEIAHVGVELVKVAQMDKEALIGIMRTLKAAKRGWKASKGLGATARVKAVATSPRTALREMRAGKMQSGKMPGKGEKGAYFSRPRKHDRAKARVDKAQKKLVDIKARAATAAKTTSKMNVGLKRNIGPGSAARHEKRVLKGEAKVKKREGQAEAARKKKLDAQDVEQGKAPRSTTKKDVKPKDDITKKKEDLKASDAKTKEELKKTTDAPKDRKAADSDTPAAGGDAVTLSGSAKKMRDSGWGSLSGDEKQKLINAGLAGVVGHRVVMGKGALTGGEGRI